MIDRWYRPELERQLRKPFVHLLFGARQTGKTTLLEHVLEMAALHVDLADPEERTRLLADPGLFRKECDALPVRGTPATVFVDEAQAVPVVFDATPPWCGAAALIARWAGPQYAFNPCARKAAHVRSTRSRVGGSTPASS